MALRYSPRIYEYQNEGPECNNSNMPSGDCKLAAAPGATMTDILFTKHKNKKNTRSQLQRT
jgi:hypothetical protein